MILPFIALLAAGLFAGAALIINVAEHPARMLLPMSAALAEWRASYARAAVMQASLAVIGSAAALAAGLTGGGALWLAAAAFLFAVVPFTLVVIRPTNKKLMDAAADLSDAEAARLLASWNRLHALRTALGLAAFALTAYLALWA